MTKQERERIITRATRALLSKCLGLDTKEKARAYFGHSEADRYYEDPAPVTMRSIAAEFAHLVAPDVTLLPPEITAIFDAAKPNRLNVRVKIFPPFLGMTVTPEEDE